MAEARAAGVPTVRRVVLGKRLQDLRERAGLSIEQAAAALDVNQATIRRMEKAEVGLKPVYVEKLLRTYGVDDADTVEGFVTLAREANEPGWWHRYRDVLPTWFGTFVSLEGEAAIIRGYEPQYVPGLLQTADYARAILRAGLPHASGAEIEQLVQLRLERQALLRRPDGPALWMVIDEAVLRRRVAPTPVMREQVDKLAEAAELSNVTLQVLPFAAGAHAAMYGPFQIFRFNLPELPDLVYSESLTGAIYLDERSDVSAYLEALDRICAMAVPAPDVAAILARLRKEI
ncbi:MAG TPA: helix-turn-helix transcriptional regulator [Actinocrinis sp.]